MKKTLSYLLLCIYATIMVKPVMPSITDALEHVFNYSDHVATVHHDHGKKHVHYEYIEASKKDSHGDAPYNTFKKTDDFSEHVMFTMVTDLSKSAIPHNYRKLCFQHLLVISQQGNLRPPILCLT